MRDKKRHDGYALNVLVGERDRLKGQVKSQAERIAELEAIVVARGLDAVLPFEGKPSDDFKGAVE